MGKGYHFWGHLEIPLITSDSILDFQHVFPFSLSPLWVTCFGRARIMSTPKRKATPLDTLPPICGGAIVTSIAAVTARMTCIFDVYILLTTSKTNSALEG